MRRGLSMSIDYSDMAFPKPAKKVKKPRNTEWKRQKKPQKPKKECKQPWKKKMKKIPSIMQGKDDHRCFLCMLLKNDYRIHSYVEEHHVLFGDLHILSDWYGLRVNLCVEHHRIGDAAVHNNQKNAERLMAIAQRVFAEEFPELDWMEVVGKNYLEVGDEATKEIKTRI